MLAVTQRTYGKSDLLKFENLDVPELKSNEVLVKVHATTVNDFDCALITGKPIILRLMMGLLKPKFPIPGMEFAGTIEKCGTEVTNFKVGDRVYGDTSDFGFETFAEYFAIHQNAIKRVPKNLSFVEAAAIPHAGMLAYQALKNIAKIKNNQKILINGAGGGVGAIGLQFAKLSNAHVTGVDSAKKLEQMKNLGFDAVIDYREKDFTKLSQKFDVILDAKTNRHCYRYLQVLGRNGIYVTVGGDLDKLFEILLMSPILEKIYKKKLKILALKPNKGLEEIEDLLNNGKLKMPIEGPYKFQDAPIAVEKFEKAEHFGKVVIEF